MPSKMSKAQELHLAAKQKLDQGGITAVKQAMKRILDRVIDSRGGHQWDGHAIGDPDYFVNLKIVAEWIGDKESKGLAEWRQERFEQYGH